MYLIYVSTALNVSTLANIWGQEHTTVHNGVLQSIHIMLKQHPTWSDKIRSANVPRNARVVRLENAFSTDKIAIEFTGAMEDAGFQVIASIDDADVDAVYAEFTSAQRQQANSIAALLVRDAESQIDKHGVFDNTAMVKNKLQVSFSSTDVRKEMQTIMDNKKSFISKYVLGRLPSCADYIDFM